MKPDQHLQAAKEAVADKHGYTGWDEVLYRHNRDLLSAKELSKLTFEAAELALTNQAEELRKEKADSWIDVNDRLPELGDEYNVVWELKDGGKPVSTTVQWDAIRKIWFDETYPDGVPNILFWQPLPQPKHI